MSGKYALQSPFPSVAMIIRRFKISNLTAVKVLATLKGEGLVLTHQGRGTFVTRTGALRKIGLILPGIVPFSEYFQPIVSEMTRLACAESFELRLGNITSRDVKSRTHEVRELAAEFIRSGVAGLLYQPIEYADDADVANARILSVFSKAKIPAVVLDGDILPPPERSSYDVVTIDNADAGERVANHLYEQGARNVHFFMLPERLPTVAKRLRGVLCSAVLHGRRWTADNVVAAQPDDKAAVRRLFRRRIRPDAFVCENDMVAVMLMRTLAELNLKVPDDVMVAGFDDMQYARLSMPGLTTIHQPCAEIAEAAFRRLVSRITHPQLPPICLALPAPLVIRESTCR